MTTTSTTGRVGFETRNSGDYQNFLAGLRERFNERTVGGLNPLFQTDADDAIWAWYLGFFQDEAERQHHNCHCCRHFLQRFGGLVTIDPETGRTRPAMWFNRNQGEYGEELIAHLEEMVRKAKVVGVFKSSLPVWGTPVTGEWTHMHVIPDKKMLLTTRFCNTGQYMAGKREDYKTMLTALGEYSAAHLAQAVKLLKTDALYRSEKVLGAAEWLHNLILRLDGVKGQARNNLLWLAVAEAPAGFCHPRSSMIGTLLEDIVAGLPFDDVANKFKAKMHPLQYQRPQALPSAGAVVAAEKLVEKLGIAESLPRRWAMLSEIQTIWTPQPAKDKETKTDVGVFQHLRTKEEPAQVRDVIAPAQVITWDKFQRTVLPDVLEFKLLAPEHGDYGAFTTAVNPDAPPILQWDHPDVRNPVAWYVYQHVGGSRSVEFNVDPGAWVKVVAVANRPCSWFGNTSKHFGNGVMLVLDDARDLKSPGVCLFPETLKSELHGVRSVTEAYSKTGKMQEAGAEGQRAAGLLFTAAAARNLQMRVRTTLGWLGYSLDRWD